MVDDEEEICEITRSFLRKKNYCTLGATSQEEAINVVRKEKPHLVLLDVRLGGESGLEVLRQIKQVEPATRVIMVTALNDEESMNEAKASGADDYIIKPFTADYLNETILKKIADLGLRKKENR
mgnify:CR=1 FL=1